MGSSIKKNQMNPFEIVPKFVFVFKNIRYLNLKFLNINFCNFFYKIFLIRKRHSYFFFIIKTIFALCIKEKFFMNNFFKTDFLKNVNFF